MFFGLGGSGSGTLRKDLMLAATASVSPGMVCVCVCELVIELLQDQGIKDEPSPVSGWGCFVFVRDMMHWVRGLVRRYLYHVQQLHGAYTQ